MVLKKNDYTILKNSLITHARMCVCNNLNHYLFIYLLRFVFFLLNIAWDTYISFGGQKVFKY